MRVDVLWKYVFVTFINNEYISLRGVQFLLKWKISIFIKCTPYKLSGAFSNNWSHYHIVYGNSMKIYHGHSSES